MPSLSASSPSRAAIPHPSHGVRGLPTPEARLVTAAPGGRGGPGVGLSLPSSSAASPAGPPAPLLRTARSVHRGAVSHEWGLARGPGLPAGGGDGTGGREQPQGHPAGL